MIPKIFHAVWIGDELPEKYEKFWLGWKEKHPDWEFKLWTDNLPGPRLGKFYGKAKDLRVDSNFARLEILYEYGGVYIDLDMECLKPIDPLLESCNAFITIETTTDMKVWGRVGFNDAPIGAAPRHPAINSVIEHTTKGKWLRGNVKDWDGFLTGPVIFTEAMQTRVDVRVFEAKIFNPWSALDFCIPESARPPTEESYAIHHYGSLVKVAENVRRTRTVCDPRTGIVHTPADYGEHHESLSRDL